MDIRTLEASDIRNELLCKGFLLTHVERFNQLLHVHEQYARDFPEHTILFSLDDFAQAQYTSTHAVMSYDLDKTEGHDLSHVDKSAFDDGVHIGYLSTPSEFFIREENFKRGTAGVSFEDACSKGLELDDEELGILEQIHVRPEIILDRDIAMWIVPVRDPSLALCAIPNGYFSCDLNPFENFALATHLYKEYSYKLVGIGASCIAFRRTYSIGEDAATRFAQDLTRLYNCAEDGEKAGRLEGILKSRDFLILKYVETLEI